MGWHHEGSRPLRARAFFLGEGRVIREAIVKLAAGGSQTTLGLISATIADGMTAMIVTLAMSFGLITPKLVIDYLRETSTKTRSQAT